MLIVIDFPYSSLFSKFSMFSYPFYLAILPVHFGIQEKDFNALRYSVLAVCTDYGVECPGSMIGSGDAKSTGRRMKMEPVGQWDR